MYNNFTIKHFCRLRLFINTIYYVKLFLTAHLIIIKLYKYDAVSLE
jgi:hypothetical protein